MPNIIINERRELVKYVALRFIETHCISYSHSKFDIYNKSYCNTWSLLNSALYLKIRQRGLCNRPSLELKIRPTPLAFRLDLCM